MARRPNASPQTLRVFDVLLEEPETWCYGYALSRRTGLASGTLYPILIRLAEQGWLSTRWAESERPGRPPRHLYRLTAEGARHAAAAATTRTTPRAMPRPSTGLAGAWTRLARA